MTNDKTLMTKEFPMTNVETAVRGWFAVICHSGFVILSSFGFRD
jgi:hypothetical protein